MSVLCSEQRKEIRGEGRMHQAEEGKRRVQRATGDTG